ncbi:MAG: hypothetical protein MASP_01908 [Candidatus Methanolliviera sp. GoM_asphalt]|nr:MAG: hypothetical protein MASP_01908 [Candidatus Methanolliviera sp. GoM_asphalt]
MSEKQEGKELFEGEWKKLVARLPNIAPPKGGNNDEKAQELLREARDLPRYEGAEDEGLNINVDEQRRMLRREAHRYCAHKWRTTIRRSLTFDSRLRVERIIECVKCGMAHRDVVEAKE